MPIRIRRVEGAGYYGHGDTRCFTCDVKDGLIIAVINNGYDVDRLSKSEENELVEGGKWHVYDRKQQLNNTHESHDVVCTFFARAVVSSVADMICDTSGHMAAERTFLERLAAFLPW